jgi:dGTPase
MVNDLKKFDGNAQAFRIVSYLQYFDEQEYGLDLTWSVLGAVIKYPWNSISDNVSKNHGKFGFFFSENHIIESMKHQESIYYPDCRNPLAAIMEAADDITCILSDFEDGVQKGHISFEDINQVFKNLNNFVARINNKEVLINDEGKTKCKEFLEEFMKHYEANIGKGIVEPLRTTFVKMLTRLREDFKKACSDYYINEINKLHGGLMPTDKSLLDLCELRHLYELLKAIRSEYIFPKREIIVAELQGSKILRFLLKTFLSAVFSSCFDEFILDESKDFMIKKTKAKTYNQKVLQLLSRNYVYKYVCSVSKLYKNNGKKKEIISDKEEEITYYKIRLVLDNICNMTDTYAKDTFLYLSGIK